MVEVMNEFKGYCGMPSIHGAIDGCHIPIVKPPRNNARDYFCYKTKGSNILLQGVVDKRSRFLDVFVGLPGTLNDNRMIRKSDLYERVMQNGLLMFVFHRPKMAFPPIC